MSARRALLGELIDDAGLFPPAQLALSEALAANARAAAGAHFWMLGRFVVPASRLGDLRALLDDAPEPFAVSVVLDGELDASLALVADTTRAAADRIAVETLECRASQLRGTTSDERIRALVSARAKAALDERPVYLELDAAHDDLETLAALHRARAGAPEFYAKLRCGGLAPEAVPAPERVARFLWEANRLGVPFKATAGLHHPIRAYNAGAGFVMHGFLNLVGAAVLAHARGLDQASLERVVADERATAFALDEARFVWNGLGADAVEIGAARAQFVHSYGSCSFDEPVADLRDLGIL